MPTVVQESPPSANTPAFTLIELLLVIAIIAILAALLLPALAAAWIEPRTNETPALGLAKPATARKLGLMTSAKAASPSQREANRRARVVAPARPLCSLAIYLGGAFLAAALLAPGLYLAAQSLAQQSDLFRSLAQYPFHRYVSRALLVAAVLGLWPFLHSLQIRTWAEVGWKRDAAWRRRLLGGFATGFMSLACLAVIVLAAGGREFKGDLSHARMLRYLLNATTSAAVVSVLEETFLRGAIFGSLRRAWSWRVALGVSSGVYALLHFLQPVDFAETVHWQSGVDVLARMLGGFVRYEALVPGLFNLALVGMVLALTYQRTGSLYFAVGLHAGWIFWLKASGFFTRDVGGSTTWLWGTRRLVDGWLAVPVLLAVLLLVHRCLRGSVPSPAAPDVTA